MITWGGLRVLQRLDGLSRRMRCCVKVLVDASLVIGAFLGASLLRFGGRVPAEDLHTILFLLPFVVLLKTLTFSYFGMMRDMWRYAGLSDLVRLVRVVGISSLLVATFNYLAHMGNLPRGIFVIDAALTLILLGGVRFSVRWLREMPSAGGVRLDGSAWPAAGTLRKVLIIGGGHAGQMMIREMRRRLPALRMQPIGVIDDDPAKRGMLLHGLTVLGGREDIPEVCSEFGVDRIVLCLPSVPGKTLREIVRHCRSTTARLDIVPRIEEILSGDAKISDVRRLQVEDLLGRQRIEFDMEQVAAYLQGKRVLVTGAGGSIGSELCRQIVQYGPAELSLLGRGENSIFAIGNELADRAPRVRRNEIIGDVINKRKLVGVFNDLRPDIVFHAGADKHVPLMEINPDEAVLNNIIGTRNVLDVADETGVQLLVSISTDKAVRPTSVMGCCKRVAEMIIQSRPRHDIRAVAVRFGNVLGSRGSVIPYFQEQIRKGGPVTVTHPDIQRYFMTIPEAVALVMQAGALGSDRDLFVLDMGEPVRIADLAREMIELAGMEPEVDIPIVFTGLRPGEKLHEELAGPGEAMGETSHPKIMTVRAGPVDPDWLDAGIERLREAALAMDADAIITTLQDLVKEYTPARHRAPRGHAGRPLVDLPPPSQTH